MKKLLIFFSFFLFGTGSSVAQTKIKVNYLSGTAQDYYILGTGKMYFSDSELIVDEGNSNLVVIPIADIRSVVFNEQTLGVVNLDKHDGAVLYPNPVNNYVSIHTKNKGFMHVEIFNLQGQLVHTGNYYSDSKIDVSRLSSGVYVIKTDSINFKFIKK